MIYVISGLSTSLFLIMLLIISKVVDNKLRPKVDEQCADVKNIISNTSDIFLEGVFINTNVNSYYVVGNTLKFSNGFNSCEVELDKLSDEILSEKLKPFRHY